KETGFAGPGVIHSAPAPLPPDPEDPAELKLHPVSTVIGCKAVAEGGCLKQHATYHFRVVATNADNPTGEGEASAEGPSFVTEEHLKALWASEVGTDGATLSA